MYYMYGIYSTHFIISITATLTVREFDIVSHRSEEYK